MDKVVKARTTLVLDEPFFGSIIMRMDLIESRNCPGGTMATDGYRIIFNPDFVDELTMSHTKAILAHEVLHVANLHHTRMGNRDPEKWNIAGDYAINSILKECNYDIPDYGLYNARYKDMTTEEIYAILPDGQSGSENGQGQSQGGQGQNQNQGGNGQSGQNGGSDPGRMGIVIKPRSLNEDGSQRTPSSAEIQQAEEDQKLVNKMAANIAKAYGRMPAGMDRVIQDMLEPKINWTEALRDFVEKSSKGDYDWRRPNSRHLQRGFYLPSLHSQCIGTVAIAVDTSGSIGQAEIDQFAGEITQILQEFAGLDAKVFYIDTHLHIDAIEEFGSNDFPIELHPKGGGGTDFRPVFDYYEKQSEVPTCLIYFTDMWCSSYPQNTPQFPVLWANTTSEMPYGPPPFGSVIHIPIGN
jgi:predicted metal-dependent peptidase